MRPTFAAVVFTVAILAIGAMIFVKSRRIAAPASAPAPVASVSQPDLVPPPVPVTPKKVLNPEERQAAIDAEKDKLYAWSMSNDRQSFSNILGDLVSPEKEVRMAAIEATKQFGDTNAIPVLRSLAANILANAANNTPNADANGDENAPDNDEAIKMIQAADFIALPPVTWVKADPNAVLTPEQQQVIDASRAKAAARRQAMMQKRRTNSSSITFPDARDPQTLPANP